MPYIDGLPTASAVFPTDLVAIDQGGTTGVPGTATTRSATLAQVGSGNVSFVIDAAPFLNHATIVNGLTITSASIAAQTVLGLGGSTEGVPVSLALSSDLTVTAGETLALTNSGTAGGPFNNFTMSAAGRVTNASSVAYLTSQQWTAGNVGTVVGGTVSAGTLTIGGLQTLTAGPGIQVNGTFGAAFVNGGTVSNGQTVNTTTSTTLGASDQAKFVVNNQAGGAGVTVNTASLTAGWWTDLLFPLASSGQVAPTSGTINGGATLYMAPNQYAHIEFDGTNYHAGLGTQWTVLSSYAISYTAGALSLGASNTVPLLAPGVVAIGSGHSISVGNPQLAFGQNHKMSNAAFSAALGQGHTLSGGQNGMVMGYGGQDAGVNNTFVHATSNVGGPTFGRRLVMTGWTSGASALRATTDGAAAAASNTGKLLSAMGCAFEARAVVHDQTTGGWAIFVGQNANGVNLGLIAQTGTAVSTTSILAGFSFTLEGTLGSIAALGTVAISNDTTLGGFDPIYQPGTGNTSGIVFTMLIDAVQA